MFSILVRLSLLILLLVGVDAVLAENVSHKAPGVTSLTNSAVKFHVPKEHFVVLKRGPVTAVIVDNAAVDNDTLPGHRAGYNGVASLTHADHAKNLFVPSYAGLNFEHIHDGTLAVNREKFEPRRSPMQLRVIDEHTVEVYQSPTPNWKLESCGRYHLLEDGALEYTFECIPRADTFNEGTLGLFWASYIHEPTDKSINFAAKLAAGTSTEKWVQTLPPSHGVNSTHPPADLKFTPDVHPDFPLTLVNHPSKYVYTRPFYYGVNGNMALAQLFRQRDQIWFAQSPTGGGAKNPAWDFQWFVPNVKVGQSYGFVMRAKLTTYSDREELLEELAPHVKALNP